MFLQLKHAVFFSILFLFVAKEVFSRVENPTFFQQDRLQQIKLQYQKPLLPELSPKDKKIVKLGEELFFDPKLSSTGRVSCATCHVPNQEWSDHLPLSRGLHGQELKRRTPEIWNLRYANRFFWDGRATTLEGQAAGPLFSREEMGNTPKSLVDNLSNVPSYREKFAEYFSDKKISVPNIVKAIAEFERQIVDEESSFDRFVTGDNTAISEKAVRGLLLFNSAKTRCIACHATWRFTQDAFHDIGLKSEDLGRGGFYRESKWNYQFKTPSLRRAKHRPFFMHDGSLKSLREVLEFYNRGGDVSRPTKSPPIAPLGLNSSELDDLEEFLNTL
jgi:cytochrome c peroxidase